MMQRISTAVIAAALIGGMGSTSAQAEGFYGYLSAGSTSSDRKAESDRSISNAGATAFTSSAQSTSTGYKLQLGYQFNSNFALEGGYVDMGKYSYHAGVTAPVAATRDVTLKVSGLNLDAVGILPISDSVDVFGKLGFVSYDLKYSCLATGIACANPSLSSSGTPLHYGLGGDWNFSPKWFARAEYEVFQKIGDALNATGSTGTSRADVTMAGIGIGYRF